MGYSWYLYGTVILIEQPSSVEPCNALNLKAAISLQQTLRMLIRRDSMIMDRRMLYKTGLLVGLCGFNRFNRYTNNSGLVAEIEDENKAVYRASCTHLSPCMFVPEQVQIDNLPANIVEEDL